MRKSLFFNQINPNQNGVLASPSMRSGVDWNAIIAIGGLIGLVHVAEYVKNELAANSVQPQSQMEMSRSTRWSPNMTTSNESGCAKGTPKRKGVQ